MFDSKNTIYAFDFDGVICDSAIETSITGWKVAQQVWPEMQKAKLTDSLINDFRQVRPYLETGYEALLIMRLLNVGVSANDLWAAYEQQMDTLIRADSLDTGELKEAFGNMRDKWIEQDEQQWLSKNPLFASIAEKLQLLSKGNQPWYIITTKQQRFVERILAANQIELSAEHIYGMDSGLSKQQVLESLCKKHCAEKLVFVEDRLPTLQNILKNFKLDRVDLQFVDWGYNTPADRKAIAGTRIKLLTLEGFLT